MPIYQFVARDKNNKIHKGTVEANNLSDAAGLVRERQMFVTQIVPVRKGLDISFGKFRKISFSDIVNFTRQLSTMVTAGLQLQEAISLLKLQSNNQAMIEMLTKISQDIQGGSNLGNSLAKYPQQFANTYVSLIRAGEASGTLDKVLERLADNLEKDLEFRSRIKGAMVYPTIIMAAMFVVFGILMTVVVPKLIALYSDFGADLPLSTRILKGISDFMVRFWWIILLVMFVAQRIFAAWRKTFIGRHAWDAFLLQLPIFGPLQKQIILVEFTRTLGMLIGAGVHILDSLNILVESMNNALYQDALKEITKKVEKGFAMGVLFAQYEMFPPILAQMLKVGEETGKMDESLLKLSTYFERESEHTVKGLTTAIEPLIMVVLGVGVGFIVFSIITPIYNLTNQFQ